MKSKHLAIRLELPRAICCVLLLSSSSYGQATSDAKQQSGALQHDVELKQTREKRQQFQTQELITAKRNHWVFKPGDPPRIVWRDAATVRQLGFNGPLRVRWFDAQFQEAMAPNATGRWGAWVEGTAPNGTPFRRAFSFYALPKKSLVVFAPQVDVTVPEVYGSEVADVWREHELELSRISTDLVRGQFIDNELSAVALAGLAESQRRGRKARFVESTRVLNDDYHLALKLKQQGLEKKIRPLQPPQQRTKPATHLRDGSLSEAGMSADAKTKIDAICRQWAEDTSEPFVTLVARRGVIVTHEAFGNDTDGSPITKEYRCWVGSITKTVTALLFSQFVDQGLIDLDDSLAEVFPDYPRNDSHVPTFRQCLNHTSGLTGHGNFGGFRNPHLENVILNAIDVNEPGARYAYSGTGFELTAKAMEIVAGKSAVRLYHEHFFGPLGFGDVPIGNASSDGEFTARELAIMAQWVANQGSYGELEFIKPATFERLLPRAFEVRQQSAVKDEGIGLHWVRHTKPGAPRRSSNPDDWLFSPRTVGHGSFSGCIFLIDLDQDVIIAQARRQSGKRSGEWSAKLFQTIAESIIPGGDVFP